MSLLRRKHKTPVYFIRNVATVLGLVLVWRGIWQILDSVDYVIFGGSHWFTAIVGFIIGLLLLYVPDRDLKELRGM